MMNDRFSFFILVASIFFGVVSCAQIRELTYPEGFTYIEKSEVEHLMHEMTDGVAHLNVLVSSASVDDMSQQKKIIAELSSLEAIAIRLSGGHTQTNQFVISDHIERFISDLGTAKMFASHNPPKYNKARDLVYSCQECHEYR